MSNLDPAPEAIVLAPGIHRAVDVLEARKTVIGDGTEVRRLLPQRTLRTVGPLTHGPPARYAQLSWEQPVRLRFTAR